MSTRGEGVCGTPKCDKPKAPDRFLCEEHARLMDPIKEEFNADPTLLYNQRSDNPDRRIVDHSTGRAKGVRRKPRLPTCCMPGCYELRVPPNVYCDAHEGQGGSDH